MLRNLSKKEDKEKERTIIAEVKIARTRKVSEIDNYEDDDIKSDDDNNIESDDNDLEDND